MQWELYVSLRSITFSQISTDTLHVIIVASRIITVGEADEDAKTKIGKVLVHKILQGKRLQEKEKIGNDWYHVDGEMGVNATEGVFKALDRHKGYIEETKQVQNDDGESSTLVLKKNYFEA